MREHRHIPIHGLVDLKLACRVCQMVDATYDVGDAHVMVVDDHGEIVGGVSIAPHDDEIVEILIGEHDAALHLIIDDGLALARGLQADYVWRISGCFFRIAVAPGAADGERALFCLRRLAHIVEFGRREVTAIGVSVLKQLVGDRAVAMGLRELRDGLTVPIKLQPFETIDDGSNGFRTVALAVRILDAQKKGAAAPFGIKPIEQCRACAANVQKAGWRRGEPHDRRAGAACLVRHLIIDCRWDAGDVPAV